MTGASTPRARRWPGVCYALAGLLSVLSIASAGAYVGCIKQTAGPTASDQTAIDEPLLAYLSLARSLHHEADLEEDAGDLKGAIATLQRLFEKPPPHKSPEADDIVADTRARLGDLESRLGDFDGGAKEIDHGLVAAEAVSYFRGHLLEVRGLIEERRAKALTAKGDVDGASKAREAAMKAFEDAISVQHDVIDRAGRSGGSR